VAEEEETPTANTLLKEIQRGAAMIRGGYAPRTCEEFAMRRLTWRVRYDLKDGSALGEAMRLLEAIIPHGIELLRHIDWRSANSRLISSIASQTGIDLGL
jgi:hypothetical protein